MIRHIYVGMSKKVWCGEKLSRDSRGVVLGLPPITEGEFIDGFGALGVCDRCADLCAAIRGPANVTVPEDEEDAQN
jgi:hypothetical protein